MKRLITLLPIILLLAACGGGEDAGAAQETPAVTAQEAIASVLEVAMNDLYFGETPDNMLNPPEWTVGAGETVELVMTNNGALEHNWAIVKPGAELPVPFDPVANVDALLWEPGLVDPAEERTVTFVAPDAGEYLVICTVAGHYPAMQGRLIVQ